MQILKENTATDRISLLISRDADAQSDFRRLSDVLDQEYPIKPHVAAYNPAAEAVYGKF